MSRNDSSESDGERGRLFRFRRWLAYKIMPGTSEFNVAVARQRAMHELSVGYDKADSYLERESFERAYRLLEEHIPVRPGWHTDFRIGDRAASPENTGVNDE